MDNVSMSRIFTQESALIVAAGALGCYMVGKLIDNSFSKETAYKVKWLVWSFIGLGTVYFCVQNSQSRIKIWDTTVRNSEMQPITSWEDVVPFAGSVVAYKTNSYYLGASKGFV